MKQLTQILGLMLNSVRLPRPCLTALLGLAAIFILNTSARGSVLFTEEFNYTAGTSLTASGWTAESGSGTNPLKAQSPGLTYAGYLSSGVGLACPMTTSGEDDSKSLGSSISSGGVYYAMLINASAAQSGDYFACLWTSSSAQDARLYIKSSGSGFNIGVAKDTASATSPGVSYASTVYSFGTTYLVVVKYTFKTGSTTDDTVDLWVNPTPGGTEPSPTLTHTGGTTDPSNLNRFVLRQGSSGSAATVAVDGIRVATTWAEAAASTCTPPSAAVSGSATICQGGSTTIQAALTGTGPWNVTWSDSVTQTGVNSSPAMRSVSPTSTTSYTVTSVSDSTGCIPGTFSGTATVTVNPLPTTSAITGSAAVCAGAAGVHYSVTLTSGSSYAWTVPGDASITSGATGPNNNEIVVTFGTTSGNVTATETSAAGCVGSAVSKSVTVNPIPTTSAITGSAAVCAGAAGVHYSVTLTTGSSYAWTVPSGASITSGATGPNNNEIVVTFGATGGNVTATETSAAGCVGSPVSAAVTVNALPSTSAITGSTSVAQNQAGVHYSVTPTSGSSYAWTVPSGASITSGASGPDNNEIVVTFGTSSGVVTVQETSSAGCVGSVQSLAVGMEGPPTISAQPADQTVCAGSTAAFSVTAFGAGTIGYQWRRDGTNLVNGDNISGADTATLTINPAGAADAVLAANGYDCNVTNEYGSTPTSPKVALTVNALPAAFNVTGGGAYCAGGAGVSVGLDGSASGVTYTLKRSAVTVASLPGSGSALDFGLQTVAGTYSVVATNDTTLCNVAMTGSATVTVTPLPVTSAISGSAAVCSASAGVAYSVILTSGSSYAWTVPSGASITSGATGPDNNQIIVTFGTTGGNVTATETSAAGCVGSPVSLTVAVSDPVSVSVQPANVTALLGATAQFSVSASGVVGYQWQENGGSGWNNVSTGSGATTATYTTAALATSDNGKQYRCQLSNGCGTVASDLATLSVASYARSKATGAWNDPSIWEWSTDGVAFTAPVSAVPVATNSDSIEIQGTHTVAVTNSVSADQLTVDLNGQLTIATNQTLTVANGTGTDLSVAGTVEVIGTLTIGSGATVAVNNGGILKRDDGSTISTSAGTLVLNSGGKYQHNTISAGTIPTATWNSGSTCEIIGYTSNTTAPSGLGQSFYHFTWNCPAQTQNLNLSGGLSNVLGNFTVITTGTGSLRLIGISGNNTVPIGGNLNVQGGTLACANNSAVMTINLAGNLNVSGGILDLKNSSGGTGGGCTLNITGNVAIATGAMLTNSSGTRVINFVGTGTQTYANAGTVVGNIAWTVASGATLDLGTNVIPGTAATFTNSAGGSLKTAHASGFNGNLAVTGNKSLNSAGNYTYNGTVAQVTGSLLPATVNNLTIANTTAAVQLSQDVAVSGTLTVASSATLDFNSKAVTVAAAPALNGALVMEVTKTAPNAFSGSKLTQSAGTLAYGGTLAVSASGSLASGDVIPLFVASGYSGGFGSVTGPTVPAGLVRDVTQLTGGTGGNIAINCDGTLLASAGPGQTICAGSGVAIGGSPTASGGSGSGYTYAWTPATGLDSATAANPTASPSATTVYTVTVTDSVGCTAQAQVTVTVNPLADAIITAASPVCGGSAGNSASVVDPGGATFAWTIGNGSIQGSTTGSSVAYTAGASGSVSLGCTVTITATGCSSSGSKSVTINPVPTTSAITGTSPVNANQADVHYSVTLTSGSSYAWTVPTGATITSGSSGPDNNEIVVTFGTTSGNVTVTETSAAGCVGSPVSLAVTVQSLAAPVTITGIESTSLTYNGGSGSKFILLTSGTADAPMSSWTPVNTNSVTPGTFTIPAVGSSDQSFYRIQSE
jgi:large repetitive protein